MIPSHKVIYKGSTKKFIKFDIYNEKDLLETSDKFRKNRSFTSWREVFYDSLKAQRNKWKHLKRSYDEAAERLPNKIIKAFFDILIEDLLENRTEFIFNPKAKEENQLVLKMGYIKNIPDSKFMKKTALIFPYSGVHYTLRITYPKNWKYPFIPRRVCFHRRQRRKVWNQLDKGQRYYNSFKEEIFSKL